MSLPILQYIFVSLRESIIRLESSENITWSCLEYELKDTVNIEPNYSILQMDHSSEGVEEIQMYYIFYLDTIGHVSCTSYKSSKHTQKLVSVNLLAPELFF